MYLGGRIGGTWEWIVLSHDDGEGECLGCLLVFQFGQLKYESTFAGFFYDSSPCTLDLFHNGPLL